MSETDDFNEGLIAEFRANGGRVTGPFADTPMILIHHIGARSRIERVTPLAYTPHGDGRYVIVASNGGSATHPHWYFNVRAHPRIVVEVGGETFIVLATELAGAARAERWRSLVAAHPHLADYQSRTTRQIPVLELIREV